MNATSPILTLMSPVLHQASSLPAMPEVAARLLDTLQREDLALEEVSALIACDQALALKVLRLANSARYSAGRGVATLHDAAATLGLRSLRDLTLSACLVGAFPAHPGFDRMAFWQGSMATAAYARRLAGPLQQDEDVAWLCGLMLRSGQLLMLQFDAQRSLQVQRLTAQAVDAAIGYERSMIGCSHPEVSAELARHWRFPPALVDALAAAADPMERRPFIRMGAVLRLASAGAHAVMYLGLLALPLLGWALTNAQGHPLGLGAFHLPMLAQPDPDLADTLEDFHVYTGYALGSLIVLHLAAVAWHHRWRRDDVLGLMWPRLNRS